jgi:hypothetical protein
MSDTAMYRQQSQMGSASAIEKVRQATADHYSNGIESCSGIDQWVRGHEIHAPRSTPTTDNALNSNSAVSRFVCG